MFQITRQKALVFVEKEGNRAGEWLLFGFSSTRDSPFAEWELTSFDAQGITDLENQVEQFLNNALEVPGKPTCWGPRAVPGHRRVHCSEVWRIETKIYIYIYIFIYIWRDTDTQM